MRMVENGPGLSNLTTGEGLVVVCDCKRSKLSLVIGGLRKYVDTELMGLIGEPLTCRVNEIGGGWIDKEEPEFPEEFFWMD